MDFEVLGTIVDVELIAARSNVRIRSGLRRVYGIGQWRKLKGKATVRLPNGSLRMVELHWYQPHGIGKRDMKIKRYLDE
jgi:hypothetical protein